jgi:hypothetical protein
LQADRAADSGGIMPVQRERRDERRHGNVLAWRATKGDSLFLVLKAIPFRECTA